MTIEELIENFQWFEEWEDRYAYIIDLGKKLELMPEDLKTADTKVDGCMSQVWMTGEVVDGKLHMVADSDAFIVKGLIGILMIAYNDKTPEAVLKTDIGDIFAKLQLEGHLSPNRRNGFYAMIGRIKDLAARHA